MCTPVFHGFVEPFPSTRCGKYCHTQLDNDYLFVLQLLTSSAPYNISGAYIIHPPPLSPSLSLNISIYIMWFYCEHFQLHNYFGSSDWRFKLFHLLCDCEVQELSVLILEIRIEVRKLLDFKVEILFLFDSSHRSSQPGTESTLSACSPISLYHIVILMYFHNYKSLTYTIQI